MTQEQKLARICPQLMSFQDRKDLIHLGTGPDAQQKKYMIDKQWLIKMQIIREKNKSFVISMRIHKKEETNRQESGKKIFEKTKKFAHMKSHSIVSVL